MSTEQELIDNELRESGQTESESPRNGRNLLINDDSVFYKGLFGMILCIVPAAIIGLVLIKISLEQAKVAVSDYKKAPHLYMPSSIKRVKRGRIFALIGLALFFGELIALLAYMSID